MIKKSLTLVRCEFRLIHLNTFADRRIRNIYLKFAHVFESESSTVY